MRKFYLLEYNRLIFCQRKILLEFYLDLYFFLWSTILGYQSFKFYCGYRQFLEKKTGTKRSRQTLISLMKKMAEFCNFININYTIIKTPFQIALSPKSAKMRLWSSFKGRYLRQVRVNHSAISPFLVLYFAVGPWISHELRLFSPMLTPLFHEHSHRVFHVLLYAISEFCDTDFAGQIVYKP